MTSNVSVSPANHHENSVKKRNSNGLLILEALIILKL